MIEFLVTVLILLVVLYVINLVLAELTLPESIKKITYLIIGLIALFWLLDRFGVYHMALR